MQQLLELLSLNKGVADTLNNTLRSCYSDFLKGRNVSTHTGKYEGKNTPSGEIKHYSEVKLTMAERQIMKQ